MQQSRMIVFCVVLFLAMAACLMEYLPFFEGMQILENIKYINSIFIYLLYSILFSFYFLF